VASEPRDGRESRSGDVPGALVVLGCAVRLDAVGRLAPSTLARRVDAAARAYEAAAPGIAVVVVSGGRRWGASVEADVMARELVRRGVPEAAIVRERCSLTTRDNARFSAAILARRGLSRAGIVTSPWHLPRALTLFSRAGVDGEPVASEGDAGVGLPERIWRWSRERFLTWADAKALPGASARGSGGARLAPR
jgi:uncharacterized SAM-binding protein YcdF (DUF218 family)